MTTMDSPSPTTFLPEFGSTPIESEPPHPAPVPAPDAQLPDPTQATAQLQEGVQDLELRPSSSQGTPSPEDTHLTEAEDEPASAIRLVTKAMITGPPGSTPPLRVVRDVLPSTYNQCSIRQIFYRARLHARPLV